MPTYVYRAKDRTLRVVEGVIDAESQTAALMRLGTVGVYPLVIREAHEEPQRRSPAVARRVPARTLAYMSRQLADLLGGGLSMLHALTLLAQQTEHRILRDVIVDVEAFVRDGHAFSEALSRYPEVFSPLYVSMVRAGEAVGNVEAVLGRLAELAENESELTSRARSALLYPLVVLALGLAAVIFLLTYVVPKLTALFAETDQLLPLPTRLLLATSQAAIRWWWLWIVGIVSLGWGLGQLRVSGRSAAVMDRLLLELPLVGALVRKLETARLARNVGVMIGQGVPMLQALEVAAATISNRFLRRTVAGVREAVQKGMSLSQALSASGQFPAFISNMVAVGEEAGTLETALLKVAASYERDVELLLRQLTTLLEPLLIVMVGMVVMFIVIAILLPILQLEMIVQ